jgi:hypothetical protein
VLNRQRTATGHADAAHDRDTPRGASAPLPSRFDALACAQDAAVSDEQREPVERALVRALGPAADGLLRGVRDARNVRELFDVISTAQRAIANACGREEADAFASRYGGSTDE